MDPLTAALEQQRQIDGVPTGEFLGEGSEAPITDPSFPNEKFQELLALIRKRQDINDAVAAKIERQKYSSYYTSWFWAATQAYNRQKSCSHRKGQVTGYYPPSSVPDFNVSLHTFPTGEMRIRCLSCGWNVWNRPGWAYKWAIGMNMVDDSSNSPSASEVLLTRGRRPIVGNGGKVIGIAGGW